MTFSLDLPLYTRGGARLRHRPDLAVVESAGGQVMIVQSENGLSARGAMAVAINPKSAADVTRRMETTLAKVARGKNMKSSEEIKLYVVVHVKAQVERNTAFETEHALTKLENGQ